MRKRVVLILLLLFTVYELNLYTVDRMLFPEKFSRKALYALILSLGIQYPKVVYAQAKLESGNFHSRLFKANNNLFGMTYPGKKKSVAVGLKNGYNVYDSWQGSVIDYKLWQARMIHRIDNEEDYLSYLQEHYAQSEEYITLLKKLK